MQVPFNAGKIVLPCPSCNDKKQYQLNGVKKYDKKNEKYILHCISCDQKLRVPINAKTLKICCPTCQTKWESSIDDLTIVNSVHFSTFINEATTFSPGSAAGAIGSAQNYADNVSFNAARGHGFAAEKANHLHDCFSGKDAKIVGYDNAKNGADRFVDGNYIQTKYCNSGSKCIAEVFENNQFRYWNTDGSPMKIEVPSDMHNDAIKAMEERIKKGQVKGVTDPEKAKEIIKKGSYTYQQAKNIAKFGTIESFTFDAANGLKLAGTSMGISSAISFSVALWNGKTWDDALENACYDGLKTGGVAWLGSVLTAQLGRTGVEQSLRGSTDWVVKQMGTKSATWLANGLRNGNTIYGAAAANHVSKLLRGNVVTAVATTLVLSSADFIRLFDGRISAAQVFKNLTTAASSVAGGTGGWMTGAAVGAPLGPFGVIIGGIVGSFVGGSAANKIASSTLDNFIEDDAKQMLKIIEKNFGSLAHDYLLTENEAKTVITVLQENDLPNILRNMYASPNQDNFAIKTITPLIENKVRSRKKIPLPKHSEIINTTRAIIERTT